MAQGRRKFLKAAGSAAALALVGCRGDEPAPVETPATPRPVVTGGDPVCSDPFAGGTRLGNLSFVGEMNPRMEQPFQRGLAGRLFTDLSTLDRGKMTIENDRFFIRSFAPDSLDTTAPWTIRVRGLVGTQGELPLADFEPLIRPMGEFLMECSGNGRGEHFGLMSACEWSGIPLDEVLARTAPTSKATRLLVNGFDEHAEETTRSTKGCSWVFTPEQLQRAFLATHMNGEPLSRDHGFPVRLFIPGWYGCAAIKWVDEIRWVDDDVAATSQMKEFASRTHQDGVPELARDYVAAMPDTAATPVRVEQWKVGGKTAYRIVGIVWGGRRPTDKLQIQVGLNRPYEPVDVCPGQESADSWTLWAHKWTPDRPGEYPISLRVKDPTRRTNRLDVGYYVRTVKIVSV
jgi:DMSO/TMAO reductase YedYZ molybdopterin-dependent catalytic subunit